MITIMPADEAFLTSIDCPPGADALVLRDSAGTVEGHVLFRVDENVVEVLGVECREPLMVSALIRSVLNAGDYRGATTGLCRVAALENELRRLEFRPGEDGWRVSLEEFFHGKCAGECGEKA